MGSACLDDPLGIVGTCIVDKFDVEYLIAEGGYSFLYRAQHRGWGQPVVLKFLRVLAGVSENHRAELVRAFVREGALLRQFSSRTASILQAYDVGTWTAPSGEWYPYLVLEWLEGVPLDLILTQEKAKNASPWKLEEIVLLLEPVAQALSTMHRQGVAHRDIKPGNLFVIGAPRSEEALIKLLDFGIAKIIHRAAELSARDANTGAGLASFTPWYGAPEQFSGNYGATGPWTDVFAFALVMVEMMTFRVPLEGDTLPELSAQACDPTCRPTPRARGVELPDAIDAVFQKALSVSVADRYPSVKEFWNCLCEAFDAQVFAPIRAPLPSYALSSRVSDMPGANSWGLSKSSQSSQSATPLPITGLYPWLPTEKRWSMGLGISAVGVLFVLMATVGFFLIEHVGLKYDSYAFFSGEKHGSANSLPAAASAVTAPVSSPVMCPSGMLLIPAGGGSMGFDSEDASALEKPRHRVDLPSFCMDQTEVTVLAYRACSDNGGCPRAPSNVIWPSITAEEKKGYGPLCNVNDPGHVQHPVNCVDWQMATTYCKENGKRLPTNAEWEYAARNPQEEHVAWPGAPHAHPFNACGSECVAWGKSHGVKIQALYTQDDGFPTTAPVGSFPAGKSYYGIDDLVGNVAEWVSDWQGPYTAEPQANPSGPLEGTERVIRGGAWDMNNPASVRPSFRSQATPDTRSHRIGFRCAKSL